MIFIKKFIVEILTPLNISLALLLWGLTLNLLRRHRLASVCLTAGVGTLLLCGLGSGIEKRISATESIYPPLTGDVLEQAIARQPQYIVVLGSGHISDPKLPPTSQVGGASLFRLVEGIRLHRLLPGSQLILSGGAVFDPVANATITGEVALQLGVSPQKITLNTKPENTEEEAEAVAQRIGTDPFILVTSALHMERAMMIFTEKGLHPIPAPTDYIVKKRQKNAPSSFLPTLSNIGLWNQALYEWLGKQWLNLQRIIK